MNIPNNSNIYIPDVDAVIPMDDFESSASRWQKFKNLCRLIRRFSLLLLTKQVNLELTSIPKDAQNVLWINISSTSIGDSIMELSGRLLLKNRFHRLDLLTHINNANLYLDDDIFTNVFTSPPTHNQYDLIILDIFNTNSINFKYRFYKNIRYVCLRRYWNSSYYGSDYNRMLFSYHRMNKLLNCIYENELIDTQAFNYLNVSPIKNYERHIHIAVAIGGESPIRTFKHWDSLLKKMIVQFDNIRFTLVGSKNGIQEANAIEYEFSDLVSNYVGKLSLPQSVIEMSRCELFLGADGGLMHVAEALKMSGVALFARFNPNYRRSYNSMIKPIFTKENVNDINVDEIMFEFEKKFNQYIENHST